MLDESDGELCTHTSSSQLHSVQQKILHQARGGWSKRRRTVTQILESRVFEIGIGILIALNLPIIFHEVDLRAGGKAYPRWLTVSLNVFLSIYIIELAIRIYVYRRKFTSNSHNVVDLAVVVADVASELLERIDWPLPSASLLRVVRLFRFFRFVRFLSLFKELHLMVHGFPSAAKAIFWATFVLGIAFSMWSIVFVEFINPIVQEMVREGKWEECERCSRAFSSVFNSNLTLMSQILAGDSWSHMAIPIIERVPYTAFIFVATLMSINLGLLNLILSVIVNSALDAREADTKLKIHEKGRAFKKVKMQLQELCENLDVDGSGFLSREELVDGMDANLKWAELAAVLDITKEDMNMIFDILDDDCSGYVSHSEFVSQIHKIISQEAHTMLIFIKGYVTQLKGKLGEQMKVLKHDVLEKVDVILAATNSLAGPSGTYHPGGTASDNSDNFWSAPDGGICHDRGKSDKFDNDSVDPAATVRQHVDQEFAKLSDTPSVIIQTMTERLSSDLRCARCLKELQSLGDPRSDARVGNEYLVRESLAQQTWGFEEKDEICCTSGMGSLSAKHAIIDERQQTSGKALVLDTPKPRYEKSHKAAMPRNIELDSRGA